MSSVHTSPNTIPSRASFWKKRFTWAGILVYTAFCLYVFSNFLLSPEAAVVSLGGDAVKNLYTYLYSALYNGGSLHFTGMNYPFGEHLSFADAQPLLTVPLGWLQKSLHLSPEQLIRVMYSAIAFSFVVGMAYTQRLLQHFGVQPFLAIVLSALILIMSPHLFRYTGHFPLAYASMLPMLFYWSVCYYETSRRSFLVKLFLLFTCYSFLHLYFLAMGLFWSAAYALSAVLLRRNHLQKPLWHSLRFLLPVATSFLLTKIFFALTDNITDRPQIPYAGDYEYGGGLQMLTSAFSPVWAALRNAKIVEHIHEDSGEFPYLGLVPLLMLVILGIVTATGHWKKLSLGQRSFQGQWLLIAGLTLLFAATIKYLWAFSAFNALFAPLRQFRSPERFGWIGYYVLSVSAGIVLYRLCRYWWMQHRKTTAGLFGFGVIALWVIDASGAVLFFKKAPERAIANGQYLLSKKDSWNAYLKQQGYSSQNFSALLGLPLVHVGSEKIWLNDANSYVVTPCFKASLEMQLPLVDVYMSRTSWSQTFETVRLAGGLYADGTFFKRLPQNRPLLLAYFEEYPISPEETRLLQPATADSIGTIDGCRLYAFWPGKWLQQQSLAAQEARALSAAQPAGTDVQLPQSTPFYAAHFETTGTGAPFAGRRGRLPVTQYDTLFATLLFPQALATPAVYEFSAWSQIPAGNWQSNYYYLKCYDSSGKELSKTDILAKRGTDNAPGLWVRAGGYFEVPAGTSKIELYLRNDSGESYTALDEILLRPANAQVISKLPDGTLLVNNHLVARP